MVEFSEEHLTMIIETHAAVAHLQETMERCNKSIADNVARCSTDLAECIQDHEDRLRKIEDTPGNPVVHEMVRDHEDRIRVLEAWQWKAIGAAAALSATGVYLVSLIPGIFTRGG